jgi:hypothetical protein
MKYSGYLIFEKESRTAYKGVNRKQFVPTFDEKKMLNNIEKFDAIWQLWPSGWERDAIKIYEENMNINNDVQFISNLDAAKKIVDLIKRDTSLYLK